MDAVLTSGILTSLPGRYAKALFELAKEKKQVQGIGSSLTTLTQTIESSPSLQALLKNPTLKHDEQMAVIAALCKKLKTPELVQSFVGRLLKSRRISYLTKIESIYHDLVIQEKGEEKVEVISAYPLTTTQVTLLKDKLKKVFPRTLSLTFINDTNVLGGVMVRIGCRVIDATLVTQLNQLASVMKGKPEWK
jgi:F-type H+-transporting ATPase subunit delta